MKPSGARALAPWIMWAAIALVVELDALELRALAAGVALIAAIGVVGLRKHHHTRVGVLGRASAQLSTDVVTVLGAGLARPGPGTVGALSALPLAHALSWLDPVLHALALLLITALSTVAIHDYLQVARTTEDPSEVVVDELVGVSIALAFVPWTLPGVTLAFVLFRAFDIAKPGPVGWADRHVHGARGVMLDDVIAGVLAGAVAWAIGSVVPLS